MALLKAVSACLLAVFAAVSYAENVTVDTFVRAETDRTFRESVAQIGFSNLVHQRQFPSLENQPVIRQNRDTLYSSAQVDLEKPVTLTLPDTAGRYMSVQVINQDHFMFVLTEPGEHVLTRERVGTRFAGLLVRTFADPADPADIAAANSVQDGLILSGGGAGPYEAPDWDLDQVDTARDALNTLATLGFSTTYAFGSPEQTRPVDHLVGAAAGWGGLPQANAYYEVHSVDDNSGAPYALTVGEVPVGAFWSVTVYNANGYLEPNEAGINSFNNVTAQRDSDGSLSIHFGGCDDGRVNCIPVTPGWNYTVRLYEPGPAILDGSWRFPQPVAID